MYFRWTQIKGAFVCVKFFAQQWVKEETYFWADGRRTFAFKLAGLKPGQN